MTDGRARVGRLRDWIASQVPGKVPYLVAHAAAIEVELARDLGDPQAAELLSAQDRPQPVPTRKPALPHPQQTHRCGEDLRLAGGAIDAADEAAAPVVVGGEVADVADRKVQPLAWCDPGVAEREGFAVVAGHRDDDFSRRSCTTGSTCGRSVLTGRWCSAGGICCGSLVPTSVTTTSSGPTAAWRWPLPSRRNRVLGRAASRGRAPRGAWRPHPRVSRGCSMTNHGFRAPQTLAPTPAAHPSPAGRATLGGRLRPLAWTRPRRQAVGLVQQERRRDRAAGAAPSAAAPPHHAKHHHSNDHDDQHPQPCRHGGLLDRRRSRSS